MGPLFDGAIIAMDEPEHRLYRALVAPAFRPKVLERWQTTVVQPAIDSVIDTFIDHDRVDLVEHLTFAFPVRVIARILGLPEQDVANFQRWSLDLINMFNDPEPGVRALEEFRSYFMAFITERRLAPRDDLISDLIQSEVDGHRLDDDAIFASVKMLLPAGVETTYRSLGNLLVGLLTHTHQLHALQHDRPRETPTSPGSTSPPISTSSSSSPPRTTTSAATPTPKHSISRERPRPTSRSGRGRTSASGCTSPASNPTPRSNTSWTAHPTCGSTATNPSPKYAGRCSARRMR
jgi:cytochrome P450